MSPLMRQSVAHDCNPHKSMRMDDTETSSETAEITNLPAAPEHNVRGFLISLIFPLATNVK